MENKKTISYFVMAIGILVFIASTIGILSINFKNEYNFMTVYGELVTIYGGGIYKYHTTAQVYQAIPHDMVNLLLALPALAVSFIYTRKGSLKAKLFFMGVTLYLLFTYTVYSFYTMYNKLFICYVAIMGLCFYTLYLTLKQVDASQVKDLFKTKYPNKLVGGTLIFIATLMTLFWIKTVLETIFYGTIPVQDLAQSTTLVAQAIDLGLILPLIFVMGIKLYKKKAEAYVAAVVIPVFLIFMMSSVFSKGVMLYVTQTAKVFEMMIIIGTFGILALAITLLNFKSMK